MIDLEAYETNVYQLANMADCGSPDSTDSPGAEFLASVAGAVIEHLEYLRNDGYMMSEAFSDLRDDMHSLVDPLVPVYTHAMWQTFVDLAAYREDPTELGGPLDDMTRAGMIALYMIAERLAYAIADDIEEWIVERIEEDRGERLGEELAREGRL